MIKTGIRKLWEWTNNLRIIVLVGLIIFSCVRLEAQDTGKVDPLDSSWQSITLPFRSGSGFISWNPVSRTLSSTTIDVPIMDFLIYVQSLTGWEIKAQPGMTHTISTDFENLTSKEAIRSIPWGAGYRLISGGPKGIQLKIFKDRASSATEVINGLDLAELIKNYEVKIIGEELIIRLKDGSEIDIKKIAASIGAEIIGHIPELNAYRLKFEDKDAADAGRKVLEGQDGVQAVDSNFSYSKPESPENRFSLGPKRASISSAPGADDDTVVIGLIDTAISASDLDSGYADFLLPSISVVEGASVTPEQMTHGSSMFQTIMQGLGVTAQSGQNEYNVKVLPVDVYGGAPETNTFLVAQAAATAIENGADIINLSLGGPQPSSFLQDLINQGTDKGVVFVAAAGNVPTTDPTFPAAYENVTAVTSVMSDGSIAPFANRGSFVDVAAPYGAIVQNNGMSYFSSGTSISTAFISGIAAGMSSQSGESVKAVEQRIREDFKP